MMLFKISFYYLVAILYYKLNIKRDTALYFAGKFLFKQSFRLPYIAQKDYLILLRIIKRNLLKPFITKSKIEIIDNNSYSIIFDGAGSQYNGKGDRMNKEVRIKYIKHFAKENVKFIITHQMLSFTDSVMESLIYFVWLLFVLIPTFILSVLSKNKSSFSLILVYILELWGLLKLIKKYHISKIFYFCIYENSSNINALILIRSGIHVHKIPSEVPISFGNNSIIANTLSFCITYQKEEYKFFEKQMFVEETQLWAPENILEILDLYNEEKDTNNNIIGFYSSAHWLRKYLNNIDLGIKQAENEQKLLDFVIEYVLLNDIQLYIYAHPYEKNVQYTDLVEEHYKQILNNKNCHFINNAQKSNTLFNNCDIGISLFSTILFERLYCGFKTIIAPFDVKNLPLKGSTLENISVKNKKELFEKLDRFMPLKRKEFFIKNNLIEYSFFY